MYRTFHKNFPGRRQ